MPTETVVSVHALGKGIPVVLIHGWELNGSVEAHDFEAIFSKRSEFQRLYVDLPGSGSTVLGSARTLDDILLQLVRFIDNILGKSSFLLIGSSCGAYLARALSQRYQQQVEGLLLRVPLIEADNARRDVDPFEQLVANPPLAASLSNHDRELLGNMLIETPEHVAAMKKKYSLYQQASEASDRGALADIRNDTTRYKLSNIQSDTFTAPTLIVCGRQDDVVGYRDALRLMELYPRATFAVLDRGTHALPLVEVDLFDALVNDWLNRVLEWRATRA